MLAIRSIGCCSLSFGQLCSCIAVGFPLGIILVSLYDISQCVSKHQMKDVHTASWRRAIARNTPSGANVFQISPLPWTRPYPEKRPKELNPWLPHFRNAGQRKRLSAARMHFSRCSMLSKVLSLSNLCSPSMVKAACMYEVNSSAVQSSFFFHRSYFLRLTTLGLMAPGADMAAAGLAREERVGRLVWQRFGCAGRGSSRVMRGCECRGRGGQVR
jgi:hypothetical protein